MTTPAATAYADQYAAATRQATQTLYGLARTEGVPVHHGDADPWLTDRLRDLITAVTTGRAHICPHITEAPQVIYAAVWAQQLACTTCVGQLIPDHIEDITCDRCRRAHVTQLGVGAFGQVLLAYGLCDPCHAATHATTGKASR